MRKIRLNLDALTVSTFVTTDEGGEGRGTVQANSGTTANSNATGCPDITCAYDCWGGRETERCTMRTSCCIEDPI